MELEFVSIKLNVNEYNIVMAGLGKLSYETCANLVANLSEQVKAQIAAASAGQKPND